MRSVRLHNRQELHATTPILEATVESIEKAMLSRVNLALGQIISPSSPAKYNY